MNERRSSFTASAVAYGRGLGVRDVPGDPWAEKLVEPGFSHLLRFSRDRDWLRLALSKASCGLAAHMALRTAIIDRKLEEAAAAGIDQVVILGAGLDTRSLRLPVLSACQIFEVDQPVTQEAKCLGMERVPRNLTFVAVDFESDSLSTRLAQAGHDSSRPSVWVWEGVTMYLTRSAVAQTLEQVCALSAPGSRLLVTYAHRDQLPFGRVIAAASRNAFHFSGEYLRSWFSSGDFAKLVERAGFSIHSDRYDREWGRELGVGPFFTGLFKVEHLVDARIDG